MADTVNPTAIAFNKDDVGAQTDEQLFHTMGRGGPTGIPLSIGSVFTNALPFELPGFNDFTTLFFPRPPTAMRFVSAGTDMAVAPKTEVTRWFENIYRVYSTPRPTPGANPGGVNNTATPPAPSATAQGSSAAGAAQARAGARVQGGWLRGGALNFGNVVRAAFGDHVAPGAPTDAANITRQS